MNKICTYVGTTLCTIIFLLTTAQAQNNKPVLINQNVVVETTLHQPDTVHVNEFAADPDGDYIYIVEFYTDLSSGTFTLLSDSTFKYEPFIQGCGPSSVLVKVCDTSVVYQNSLCDTFTLQINDECSWMPLALQSPHPDESVCNGASVLYTPVIEGGSTVYHIQLESSNPNDSIALDSVGLYQGTITYNGSGPRYITLTVTDMNGEVLVVPYTTVNVYEYIGDELDTDSTYINKIYLNQSSPTPAFNNHILTWLNQSNIVLKSTTLNAQSTLSMVLEAMELSVSMPGYYSIRVEDLSNGCQHTLTKYYTGMNHPVHTDPFFNSPIFIPTGGTPVIIESYLSSLNFDENDADNGRIKFLNTISNPTKGTISYINGEMYYTASNACGLDSFLAIGCDISNFLPHTTCDTIMVYVDIDCSISAQAFVVQNPSCNGFGDGSVSVAVQGSNGNPTDLIYLWSNGATTQTVNGLPAGVYTVTVTYQNATTATSTAVVAQPQALQPSVQVQNTCGAGCNGSANTSILGGTPPYTYVWSHGATAPNLTNLCIGTYSGTITDAMGCTVSPLFTVLQDTTPITISLIPQHIDCDSATGAITAMVNNGTAPYTYIWSNGQSGSMAYINLLTAGTYGLTVFDATGCAASATTTILNNSGLSASVIDSLLPSCNGATNGMVQIAVAGGVAPYTYVWAGNASTTNTATGLGAGAHTVTVSDNGGCSFAYQFTLAPQTVLNVSTTTISANCVPSAPGQVTAQVSNGTPPYSYGWNTGTTGTSIQGPAGTYQLTVTDANGCSAVNAATLPNHSLFMSAYSQPENCGQNNGVAYVIAYAGNTPYTYEWNTNPALNNDTLYNAPSGTHTIKITDALGCYRTVQIAVLADCYATLQGTLYNDANGDCIRQLSETQPVPQSTITATGISHTYYGTIYPNGNYVIVVRDTGNYELGISLSSCFVPCPTAAVNVPALNNTYAVNAIGYTTSVDEHDFSLSMSVAGLNPGFATQCYISVTSINNPNNINPTVTLNYSPTLVFVSAAGAVVDNVAHTITWPNVQMTQQGYTNLVASFTVPVGTGNGTSIVNSAYVWPDSADCSPQNNSITITRPVTGAYDPNMKVANPATEILETDSVLHYTIHFQNTGNDTTHFVILKDTLSDLVDPASFEFGGASHQPCRYEVAGTGILTFTFDPIYLVDSATNEEASKGFVNYSIKKKASTEIGAVIRNTAHIYFDYNPAIVTNTTENEVTTLVSIRNIKAINNLSAKVYPNPFAETATIETSETLPDAKLVITNINGQIIQEYYGNRGNKWQISKQNMAQGMYTFAIYSQGIVQIRGRLMAE